MTFKEAKKFIIPLGRYAGNSLETIAASPDGLKYLDWMVWQDWIIKPLRDDRKL